MEQMTIGEGFYMKTKEELQYWDQILDEYEKGIGMPVYSEVAFQEIELQEYLTMNRDAIEKLSPEDCAQISMRLSQFAFHIQRTINREQARHNWAEETTKEVIANELNNYKGYGYLEKSYQAINGNEKAASLNKIKKYAKQRIDRLSFLANNVKNLSDILLSIQRTKIKNA
jgi:hypothetical protein